MKQRFRLFCGLITFVAPIWRVCFLLMFLLWEFSLRSQVAIVLPIVPISGVSNGELLMGELNCVACHQADTTVKTRLFSRQSPRLDEGLNLTPQYLRAFLTNPSAEKPGTTMPDVLYAMDSERKAETVDALIHFLRSLMKTNASVATSANQVQMTEGRLLYHQIGCVACHAPQEPTGAPKAEGQRERFARAAFTNSVPLGNLAKKFTVDDLAGFLMNPLKARPAGRMPSMNLSEGQATALSIYLLREQTGATNASRPSVRIKGLDYEYFEGHFTETAELERVKPTATGIIERFSISPRKRTEYFGFRFTGWISVSADGAYSFYVASDDGSRLYVNEKLVVENDGHHATTEKGGTIQLQAGAYPIRVSYFNADGALELKVSYEGPGLPKQQIPPTALSHMGLPMVPLEEETLAINPEKALRGKELFVSLGCAACHQPGSTILAAWHSKPFADLDPAAVDNCISTAPQRAPKFQLSDSQRQALQSTLASRGQLAQPLPPAAQAARTMAALNCFACHSRDGVGGPTANRGEYFTVLGGADLGDEGRIPPHLTGVGDKLRPEWLREVLLNKGTARPYMATRMPQFGGQNVSNLASVLIEADARESAVVDNTPNSHSAATKVNYGRKLVGTDGLSCISCHTFAGHKSLGIPAMDLALMTRRLQRTWFRHYLLEPASLRPGTRMPTFWPEGKSVRKDILNGDTEQQIDALWAYLSRGKDAGLPPGLIQGKMELVSTNEAIIYRHFIQGAGSRGIGVAYPEKANLAFDAYDLRLALIWQGPFIDAARHRTGRGDGFEGPLGYNVIKMPPGAPFAVLADAAAKWPETLGKKAGYHMRGYRLDEKRRPAFLYDFGQVQIEDYPVAVSGEVEGSLRRRLILQADDGVKNLWFRAWSGTSIEPQSDGSFLAEGKIKLRLQLTDSVKPIMRQSDTKSELLIPVRFSGNKAQLVEEIIW